MGFEKKAAPQIADNNRSAMAIVEANLGEICCYKIFFASQMPSDRILKLQEKKVHFKPREAIARPEAGGVEKTFKSAGKS